MLQLASAAGALLLAATAAQAGNCPSSPPAHCQAITQEACAWTGQTTKAISFQGFPGSYSYQTQGYDPSSGACVQQQRTASGPLAPLSDGMTNIFRGPFVLSKFAVYSSGGSAKSKRDAAAAAPVERRMSAHERRHAHAHLHERRDAEKVHAVIDGKDVEMENTWSGSGGGSGGSGSGSGSGGGAATGNGPAKSPTQSTASGSWARTAHYADGQSDGLAFLFQPKFTDQVTYFTAADGKLSPSSSHQTLPANFKLPDNTEFIIASADKCSDSDPCKLHGKDVTAYHGFRGDRVVIAEFSMPLSGQRNCDEWNAPNPDMPAWWALGDEVVNNLQYGQCNGWKAGAGEHDIAEVLSSGSKNMFAAMQVKPKYSGTCGDSLERPTDGTMVLAVKYSGNSVSQQVLQGFD